MSQRLFELISSNYILYHTLYVHIVDAMKRETGSVRSSLACSVAQGVLAKFKQRVGYLRISRLTAMSFAKRQKRNQIASTQMSSKRKSRNYSD